MAKEVKATLVVGQYIRDVMTENVSRSVLLKLRKRSNTLMWMENGTSFPLKPKLLGAYMYYTYTYVFSI